MENLIGLLVLVPLVGAGALLCGGRRLDRSGPWLGTLVAAVSFALGAVLFADMLGRSGDERTLDVTVFSWVPVGGFRADANFHLDQLSMTFVLLITGVGTLIHLYSVATWRTTSAAAASSVTSTSSWRRCCCWSSPATTCCCTSAGRASASPRTC
ncbi:hypothetical protein GCM10020221_17710 [Streptomyces thioluteus]|uniref:NADH-Ubiquinone oxidoreductase (complex I) chain 5 N-terminal domain-containing protein n=1 Tax=Streptomyces thioluteus TaxID=66431 RepID=A0ABN3WPT4_STRTU